MKLTTIALALSLASSAAFAGSVITIDPDGAGGAGAISVASLGWNNGGTLSTPTPAGTVVPDADGVIQTYGQAALANFNDGNGSTVAVGGLNSSFQWTYVFGLPEFAQTPGGGFTSFFTSLAADPSIGTKNFFQIYYSAGTPNSILNGTGFTAGQLILSGVFLPGDTGSFTATGGATQPLDKFGTNNYNGTGGSANITSVSGIGGSSFNGTVGILDFDPLFFKNIGSTIDIVLDSFNNTPFNQTNPSSCFWDGTQLIAGAGQNSTGGAPAACATTSIGTENGISGPNIIFQTRATSDFNASSVPEPASMALVGLGLLSMFGLSRKRG